MEANFVIYRSSAGSGKTYTLVKEYLRIALRNPDEFRHTLAITFTNKAMQEMKSRILDYLEDFLGGSHHPMKGDLMAELNLDEDEFYRRCKILFNNILHKYSDFAISTIDGFFQRIIRSFTKELGIYGQYQLELDQDLVLLQAIDDLLADLKENQELTKWIIRFAEEEMDKGNSWDIRRALLNLGQEIFKENFYSIEGNILKPSSIRELQKHMADNMKRFEDDMSKFSSQAFRTLEEKGIDVQEFSYGTGGAFSFFNKIKNEDFSDPVDRSKDGQTDVNKWVKKKCDRREYLLTTAENDLMPLLCDAIGYYDENIEKYRSCKAARSFIYGLGLLSALSQKIISYKHDRDVLFIQDATLLILKLLDETDSPFIFEKTGTFFQNYLIDEFQDTSSLQWQCLKPLVEDAIASGNRGLLVGDPKQSIYRWRGGDWQLLQQKAEEDLKPQPTEIKYLKENYRSAREIISFNNAIFKDLPQQLYNNLSEEIESSAAQTLFLLESLKNVYIDAEQLPSANSNAHGYVNMRMVSSEDENHWKETVLEQLPATLDDLLNRGYKLNDIALLVRKRSEASELAQHLLSFTNEDGSSKYPVLTNEALMIGKSRSVMVIINALKYLNDKKDQVALSELTYHYLKMSDSDSAMALHNYSDNSILALLPKDFENIERAILNLSLEETVELIIRTFGLPGANGEAAYIQTFQDKVLDFARAEGNDIPSFLQWWEEKGNRESIQVPGGIEAINIVTIHKAKGLQYPVVIVPLASWSIENSFSILWANSESSPFNGQSLPFYNSSGLSKTVFKETYFQEKLQNMLDSINMLYVAFTRAEQELYAWIPEPKQDNVSKKKKSKNGNNNFSYFLYQSLTNKQLSLNSSWSKESGSFVLGEKHNRSRKKEREKEQVMIQSYLSHDWRDRMVIKKVSSDEQVAEKTSRGRKMHYYLSRIHYLEDLETNAFFKNFDDPDLLKELQEAIHHEQIKPFFSKEWRVLNEKSILHQKEIYRPDRVVIKDNSAVIIDYKWGLEQSKYHKQIKNYLSLLENMGFSGTKGYLYYVDQKRVEVVA